MRSRRVGGFRPVARAGVVASSLAMIATLLSASATIASTAIGSAAGNITCSAGFDTVQVSWSSGTYAVPAGGGPITSWSTQAGPLAGPVGLQVWRPTATANSYQLVGASPLVTLVPSTLNTINLATPISVKAGDLLGLRIEGRAYCQLTSSIATDTYGGRLGATPAVGAIAAFSVNKFAQLDIAATVTTAVTTPTPPPVSNPTPPPVSKPTPPPVTTPTPSGDQHGSGDYPSSGCSSSTPFGAKATGKSDWDQGDTDGKFSRHRNHKHNCDE
jgi:hypothetical protein